MRRLRGTAGVVAVSVLLPAVTCPTPEPPLPPRLASPRFVSMKPAAVRSGGRYREAISFCWEAPPEDSNRVDNYTVLREIRDSSDTIRTVAVYGIPRDVGCYFDPIEHVEAPPERTYKNVYYRIFATDTVGEPGDTSDAACFVLAAPPFLVNPHEGDTLTPEAFQWRVAGFGDSYDTYMELFREDSLLWRSDTLRDIFGGLDDFGNHEMRLPDSLSPLPSGSYAWAVFLDVSVGKYPSSIRVGAFHVR